MSWKPTLSLPKTAFPMRADLARRQPEFERRWAEQGFFERAALRADGPAFMLHDGPPYASGDLHVGTGMNKILKDVVVKYHTARGRSAPYVPGWDCHGLPIEHKVMQEEGAAQRSAPELRARCRKFALRNVERHKGQFRALGVFGDFERPYLTLDPSYEAGVLDVFGRLVEKGYVHRAKKPVHWCPGCATALAEAELEYEDSRGPSIYVRYELADRAQLPAALLSALPDDVPVAVMIWTTTPWTLPASMAVALHPDHSYTCALLERPGGGPREAVIMAEELLEKVAEALGHEGALERLEVSLPGRELLGARARHPFLDRDLPLVSADYVTLEDGCGCVHTAPGHGREDYVTGVREGLEILCPVDAHGELTDECGVPSLVGKRVFDADDAVCELLGERRALYKRASLDHSYPHCWRCHGPVIFRATPQWFVSVEHEGLREQALAACQEVNWVPRWGQVRIESMLRDRPDWCISRQRVWGVPIPAFTCSDCGAVRMDAASVDRVRDVVREHGVDSWFTESPSFFLGEDATCGDCGSSSLEAGRDIFDVWFESGASHHAVVRTRTDCAGPEGSPFPADVYLEGTDQHRGWFQLSLLPSLGAWGQAPFRTVITHGFVVDESGRKMSKSQGNFISLEDGLKDYGPDLLRLFFCGLDYHDDVRASKELIQHAQEIYRRLRNTFRFLLGNLKDFDPDAPRPEDGAFAPLDRWILARMNDLERQATEAYEQFRFHRVLARANEFCVTELSNVYLDARKDLLYVGAPDSPERRASQWALRDVASRLARLLAPVLAYTCEEVWEHLPRSASEREHESVHLALMGEAQAEQEGEAELLARYASALSVREDVMRVLEELRKDKAKSTDAGVELWGCPEEASALGQEGLAELFVVSRVQLSAGSAPQDASSGEACPGLGVRVTRLEDAACSRCFLRTGDVGRTRPELCERCAEVVQTCFPEALEGAAG